MPSPQSTCQTDAALTASRTSVSDVSYLGLNQIDTSKSTVHYNSLCTYADIRIFSDKLVPFPVK